MLSLKSPLVLSHTAQICHTDSFPFPYPPAVLDFQKTNWAA